MIGMGIDSLEGVWPYGSPVPIAWFRIWDIGCHWGAIHTGVDQYDFTKMDQVVDRMTGQGAKIVYAIGATPRWLSKDPNDESAAKWLGPGSNHMPTSNDEFNKFAYQLVTRYKGRIQAYEVWNEPQLKEFLTPYDTETLDQLAVITARFYKNAKIWDPACLVLGGSILPRASSGGMTRAAKYLAALKDHAWPIDYATCHIYPLIGEGGVAWNTYLKEVRTKLTEVGAPNPNAPWVTETMFNLLGPDPDDLETDTWIKGAYSGSKSLGVTKIFWYGWNLPNLGGPLIYIGTQAWASIQAYGQFSSDDLVDECLD